MSKLKIQKEPTLVRGWKKEMNKIISKEMNLLDSNQGIQRTKERERKKLNKEVKSWDISICENVFHLLSDKRKMNPGDFSNQYQQVIFPHIGDWGKAQKEDKICDLLYPVVMKRIIEESSEFGIMEG